MEGAVACHWPKPIERDRLWLGGVTADIVLPVTSTFKVLDPQVIALALGFLRDGRFEPELGYGDAVRRVFGGE